MSLIARSKTKAELDALAVSNQLYLSELIYITDLQQLVVATATNAYKGVGSIKIGDVLLTRNMTSIDSNFLKTDSSVYLKSAYPELASIMSAYPPEPSPPYNPLIEFQIPYIEDGFVRAL